MKGVLEMLPLVAQSKSTVLIEGDSGTGKELVARAIHNNGPRSNRPFVVCIGEVIQIEDLPSYLVSAVMDDAVSKTPTGRLQPLQNAEADVIRNALAAHQGSRRRAAAELGISRNTPWRKMKKFGITFK